MNQILIEKNPSPMKLDVLDVDDWEIWEQGVSTFVRSYERTETCYILDGSATVATQAEEAVIIEADDLVVLMPGLTCTWDIQRPLKARRKTD